MWHQQLSKGKLRGLSVLVLARRVRLITQSLPNWTFRVEQTSWKVLGCGEHWLEKHTLPEVRADSKVMEWRALCFLPASAVLPSLLVPPILLRACEMAANQWLQLLTVAALCWAESGTQSGRC